MKGVAHGEDLEFLFPAKGGMIPNPPIPAGTRNDQVKEVITKLWTDFAKTGNPSSNWPVTDAAKGFPYVEITEKITQKSNFFADENKFWDEIRVFLSKWIDIIKVFIRKILDPHLNFSPVWTASKWFDLEA